MRRHALLTALLATACSTGLDVDFEALSPIPQVEDLDFSGVTPADAWDYWELRFAVPGGGDEILGSGGPSTRDSLPPAVQQALDAAVPNSGFAFACLPAACFKFVAAVRDGAVEVFATTSRLQEFLGTVDHLTEAVLHADALGFRWGSDGDGSGHRRVGDSWEFVALVMVRDCAPIVVERVHFRITRAGDYREVGREEWERLENACV